jgi:hypothetical protein
LGELNKLFAARRTLYQAADFEIGTELQTPQQVTDQVVATIAKL